MLLQLILALTAMVVNALVVPPNMTPAYLESLPKRGITLRHDPELYVPQTNNERDTKYGVKRMEQFLQGHIDAVKMCVTVADQATKDGNSQFDKVFVKYFAAEDRQVVIDVFIALAGYKGGKKGSPKFDDIEIVDDYKDKDGYRCSSPKTPDEQSRAVTVSAGGDFRESIILCDPFFQLGTMDPDPNVPKRRFKGAYNTNCKAVDKSVSPLMYSMGNTLVHQYMHLDSLVEGIVGAPVLNHAYDVGTLNVFNLDKKLAKTNADSYAWFVTELFWTVECKREFLTVLDFDEHGQLIRPSDGSKGSSSSGPSPAGTD